MAVITHTRNADRLPSHTCCPDSQLTGNEWLGGLHGVWWMSAWCDLLWAVLFLTSLLCIKFCVLLLCILECLPLVAFDVLVEWALAQTSVWTKSQCWASRCIFQASASAHLGNIIHMNRTGVKPTGDACCTVMYTTRIVGGCRSDYILWFYRPHKALKREQKKTELRSSEQIL
jgi:hypothetical protein